MARSVLQKLASTLAGKPNPETFRRRLGEAEEAAKQAERALASVAYDVEAGTADPSAETAATKGLEAARANVSRLRTVLHEAESRDAQARDAAKAAQDAAEDKALADAADDVAKAAQALAATLAPYVQAYRKAAKAGAILRGLIRANPRARQDLAPLNVGLLVGQELARLAGDNIQPPGTDTWTAALGDARKLEPLADQVAGQVSAIKSSVGR